MVATIGTIVRSGEILFHGSVWLNCIDARFEALAILNRIKVEMSDDDETLRLLEVEYQRLGTTIDKFDEQRFKVKGWTITAAGARGVGYKHAADRSPYCGGRLLCFSHSSRCCTFICMSQL
jgi:hypothetical protein